MSNPPPLPHPVPVSESIESRMTAAIARFGEGEVVARSLALLAGANAGDEFLLWVGGRHAQGVLEGAPPLYWPEVWGARALIHAWDDEADAASAVVRGLGNIAWRVREMCAKVVASRALPVAESLVPLLADEVPRVRSAGARALGAVGGDEHGTALTALLADPDIEVRRSAGAALTALRARLGRSVP